MNQTFRGFSPIFSGFASHFALYLFGFLAMAAAMMTPFATHASSQLGTAEEDFIGYDAIVSELNRQTTSPRQGSSRAKLASSDPFENVLIHAGVGYTTLSQKVNLTPEQSLDINQRGIQASLGIDLFTPYWIAEGSARSFVESQEETARVAIQEFELKIIHKDRLFKRLGYRAGLGLTARYLTIQQIGEKPIEFTTPSTVGTIGMDFYLSELVSLGAEINARTAMISETIDRNSVDATVRFDTHF
jgi:hypothetical protein